MIRLIASIFLALALPAWAVDVETRQTFQHDGKDRYYYLYVPKDADDETPLVLALHGYGGLARNLRYGIGMADWGRAKGFAVAFPQGAHTGAGITHWNAGFDFSDTNDIDFLTKLTQDLQDRYGLAIDQTYLMGFSNGGYMAYRMACHAPGLYAGIAVISGTMSGTDWESCRPNIATPVLHIHDENDTMIPYEGIPVHASGWGGAPPVRDVVAFWAELNFANKKSKDGDLPNTVRETHKNGDGVPVVQLIRARNLGHSHPYPDKVGWSGREVIWEFFQTVGQSSALLPSE